MTKARRRADGHTEVTSYEPTPYDEIADGPSLVEVRLREQFIGDIEGEGTIRVTQAMHKNKSASFVGIERVHGALGGRKGSLLLQVSGTIVAKEMKAEWFVIPGSGTGELVGLRGDGGFRAQLGERGTVWLDYYFE